MSLTAPCFNFDHPELGQVARALNPVSAAWEMLVSPSEEAKKDPEYAMRWRRALAEALERASVEVRDTL